MDHLTHDEDRVNSIRTFIKIIETAPYYIRYLSDRDTYMKLLNKLIAIPEKNDFMIAQRARHGSKQGQYLYIRRMNYTDQTAVTVLTHRLRKPHIGDSWIKNMIELLPFRLFSFMRKLFSSEDQLTSRDRGIFITLTDALNDVPNDRNILRVYARQGKILGFSWGKYVQDKEWLIYNVVVDTSAEGKMIGTALFMDLLFEIEKKDPHRISVYPVHPAMERIIERTGSFKKRKSIYTLFKTEQN